MGLLNLRDLVAFEPGDNSTDVIINGLHFNRTALTRWNYVLYSNDTISNMSSCYLIFDNYKPVMISNGTFINGTSCYDPFYPIAQRGYLGITFACLFALTIVFSLLHLRNHGRMFLPAEKRFRPVGRRWQWYWQLFVAACGMISGFTGIDVDRAYLQSTPIILQNFFYFLMMPGLLAAVWEAVRHWGSWQERQIYDVSPFSISQSDRRGKTEFYMPLVFYLFAFLNFFMTVPRSWTAVQYQRSPEQAVKLSKPLATDGRFKAGSIFSVCAFLVILFNLRFSIHHYRPRSKGPIRSLIGFFHHTPTKFLLMFPLLIIKLGYQIAIAWDWYISPLKANINSAWLYGLGYTPIILILFIFDIWGYIDKNEDRELLRQRRERGIEHDAELGIVRKPGWWRTHVGNKFDSAEDRLKKMTHLGGSAVTQTKIERGLELRNMAAEQDERERERELERDGVGPGTGSIKKRNRDRDSLRGGMRRLELEDPFRDDEDDDEVDTRLNRPEMSRGVSSTRTMSTMARTDSSAGSSTMVGANPQTVRSMLDV